MRKYDLQFQATVASPCPGGSVAADWLQRRIPLKRPSSLHTAIRGVCS